MMTGIKFNLIMIAFIFRCWCGHLISITLSPPSTNAALLSLAEISRTDWHSFVKLKKRTFKYKDRDKYEHL